MSQIQGDPNENYCTFAILGVEYDTTGINDEILTKRVNSSYVDPGDKEDDFKIGKAFLDSEIDFEVYNSDHMTVEEYEHEIDQENSPIADAGIHNIAEAEEHLETSRVNVLHNFDGSVENQYEDWRPRYRSWKESFNEALDNHEQVVVAVSTERDFKNSLSFAEPDTRNRGNLDHIEGRADSELLAGVVHYEVEFWK